MIPEEKSPGGRQSLLPGTLVSIGSFRDAGHGVGLAPERHDVFRKYATFYSKKCLKSTDFRHFLEGTVKIDISL